MTRALETLSFGLFILGWLWLGIFATWTDTAPFWIGAPMMWLAALGALLTLHRRAEGSFSRSCMVAVVVFTGYVTWRALSSEVVFLARPDWVFAGTAFIAWVLTAACFARPGHRFAMLIVWSLLIMGNLVMGLWQQHVNPNANALSFLGFGRDYRDAVFSGFFPNSNHLCGFLELTAFPVLALAVFGGVHSFVRVLCALVFVAAAWSVSQSTSRGGLSFALGVLIFGAVAGVLHLQRRKAASGRAPAVGLLFAALAVVCLVLGWVTWTQLEGKFSKTGGVFNNLNGRAELWSRAYEQWQESPLTGTGARSFEYFETKYRDMSTKWVTWNEVDIKGRFTHNDWLQTLADYGLIGLFLAAVVLGLHCKRSLDYVVRDVRRAAGGTPSFFSDHRGALQLGALCGMIAFAIHCAADFQMHIGINAVLAAAVLGIMANPGAPDGMRVESPASRRGWRVAAGLAAAVPAVALAWCAPRWAVSEYRHYTTAGIFSRGVSDSADFLLAAANFQHATEADPTNYNAWNFWGNCEAGYAESFRDSPMFQRLWLKKALERYRKAWQLYPQNSDFSAFIARKLDHMARIEESADARMRRLEEAEEMFAEALKWGDGSRQIHWWYGDHLFELGRYEEALLHYLPPLHRYSPEGFRRPAIQAKFEECLRRIEAKRKADEEKRKAEGPPPAPPQGPQ